MTFFPILTTDNEPIPPRIAALHPISRRGAGPVGVSVAAAGGRIARFLLNVVSRVGGHLSSNLGVVELTIALHYVYNTPYDSLVWDVGHQTYGHKVLTGRAAALETIRQQVGCRVFQAAMKASMTLLALPIPALPFPPRWAWQ